jgi:HEPN domain-containing protein
MTLSDRSRSASLKDVSTGRDKLSCQGDAMNRAADWLKQADRDLAAAQDSAKAGYHEWAAFQAQQCAEKAAKALVQSLHGSVRGHSVTDILSHLPVSVQAPQEILDSARELDKIYVTARYPNGFAAGAPADYFTERSSRELIEQASHVLEFCRSKIR